MKKVKSSYEIRRMIDERRKAGDSIGFVPTMGGLHDGHLSLLQRAVQLSDFVVASIFVNPVQFGPGEDFNEYPRDEEGDCRMLEENGCDLVFLPDVSDMFFDSKRIGISIDGLADHLCGGSRPGHFEGVLLIVAKLFNVISPDLAVFGQKDAQQAVIIQRMAAELDFPVKIVLCPTVREDDGLAMSSRNQYLSHEDRVYAVGLSAGLREAFTKAVNGERDPAVLKDTIIKRMIGSGFRPDYVEIVRAESLEPLDTVEGMVLMAAAGYLAGTRLIDNIAFNVNGKTVREVLLEFPEWSRYDR